MPLKSTDTSKELHITFLSVIRDRTHTHVDTRHTHTHTLSTFFVQMFLKSTPTSHPLLQFFIQHFHQVNWDLLQLADPVALREPMLPLLSGHQVSIN